MGHNDRMTPDQALALARAQQGSNDPLYKESAIAQALRAAGTLPTALAEQDTVSF